MFDVGAYTNISPAYARESVADFIDSVSIQSSARSSIQVLHVGPGWGQRGGIASVLCELATLKDQFQRDAISFSFFETHGFQRKKHLFGFALFDLPRFVVTMMRRVDIVHFHVSVRGSFYRKFVLCLIARLSGKKTIFHLHAGNFDLFESRAGKVTRRAVSWFVRNSDATVAVSTAIGKEVHRLGGDEVTLHIIGNTASLVEAVASREVARSPEGDVAPYIAFAGRLTEAKGIRELMKAVGLLRKQGCLVQLKLAGGGDIGHWQQVAREYGIDDCVMFLGWIDGDEKLAFYRNAQIFCMPSHYESFGIATLEAMFSGVPVIGTRLGGFLDLVEEGVTGYLVPANDHEALAAYIRTLIENPMLAASLGTAGRDRARKLFSSEAIVHRYIQCYREVKGE